MPGAPRKLSLNPAMFVEWKFKTNNLKKKNFKKNRKKETHAILDYAKEIISYVYMYIYVCVYVAR